METAARNAFRITEEQRKYSGRSYSSRSSGNQRRSNKSKRNGSNRPNPRYNNIFNEPITRHTRGEYDMDVDYIYQAINELAMDDRDRELVSSESEREDSDYRDDDDSDEEVNNIFIPRQRNTNRSSNDKLNYVINYILTDEQRVALRNGECFFCKQKGHVYRSCPARKTYLASGRKRSMGNKSSSNSKSKPKGKQQQKRNYQKKKVDPNAMVYNIEDDEDEQFEEFSNDGNF